jgi:hypothetical protein
MPSILLASCNSLWRSTTQGSSWVQIFTPATGMIVRSAVDPTIDLYYSGSDQGSLFAGPSGANWQDVFNHPMNWGILDIKVDSKNPQIVYVCFNGAFGIGGDVGNRVYQLIRSSPAPTTMTALDITSNTNTTISLPPELVVQSIAVDRNSPLTIYAGTNRGVYRGKSTDGGITWFWTPYNNGLPLANIHTLEVHPTTGILRAATHGRSAYEVNTT